jgi:predicted N-acyltransferase
MTSSNANAYSIVWLNRISDVDQAAWDALAMPLKTPLLEWQWLRQMEDSGSIVPSAGWQPSHLTVWSGHRLVGAAPLYIKFHSAGEFVFDHIWAKVALELGISYYPKLVGMSPVTPAVGYRFLLAANQDRARLTALMVEAIDRFCLTNRLSGVSFLFVDPEWGADLSALGFVGWLHQSYAWENPGFKSFDDYLAIFNTNQRRNIKRERQSMSRQGIRLQAFGGDSIPHAFLPLMYRFYERTNAQFGPWGCRYLTQDFFEGLFDTYRHRLLLMAAFGQPDRKSPLGMAMLLSKGDQLIGRYWGCARPISHLHFNACFYEPIQWAIDHSIHWFDPGAGSPHKILRGFRAIGNHSLHRFYHRRLAAVLRTHIDAINRLEQQQIDALNAQLPFAKA